MQVDGFFLRRCKQGTLQFVLLKPIMALLTIILYAAGAYTDGDMSINNGYFYISILYNVCYTFALYGLMLFWIGASELLQPFNPLLKFILVKTVIFLTFWQGIAISYINSMGEISDPEDGKALQNFMICVEMALAGTSLLYAFPHSEFNMGGSTHGWRLDAFLHAISIRDVVVDTIHVFAPSYSDYVLYSDGGPADNVKRKKYRGQKGAASSEHPKAGLMKNMERGVLGDDGDDQAADGRRSKTPEVCMKKLEANRKAAILLDSDSDGMDSEDEGHHLGTEIGTASDSDDEAAAGKQWQRRSSTDLEGTAAQQPGSAAASRRTTRQTSSRQRGYSRSSQSMQGRKAGQAAAVAAPAVMRMPIRGPILSDSSDDDDDNPAPGSRAAAVNKQSTNGQEQQGLNSGGTAAAAAVAEAAAQAAGDGRHSPAPAAQLRAAAGSAAAGAGLAPPVRARGAPAARAAAAATAGASAWEPAFHGQEAAAGEPAQPEAKAAGGWADNEQGWADVKL
ncbi:hypothetical protein OEZ86_000476 [Tetradesmus obliquus]|nr:hypothetical protein OEZ86_000476 [Tetradesmus obliquus]